MNIRFFFFLLAFIGASCTSEKQSNSDLVFIKGGILLNVQDKNGNYYNNIKSYVLFQKNEILDIGIYDEFAPIPENTRVINAT